MNIYTCIINFGDENSSLVSHLQQPHNTTTNKQLQLHVLDQAALSGCGTFKKFYSLKIDNDEN